MKHRFLNNITATLRILVKTSYRVSVAVPLVHGVEDRVLLVLLHFDRLGTGGRSRSLKSDLECRTCFARHEEEEFAVMQVIQTRSYPVASCTDGQFAALLHR